MPALAPVVDLVSIDRIHKGEPASEELGVQYRAPCGSLPGTLVILSGWHAKSASYRRADFYHVELLASPCGRAFRLHRTKRAVERDPDHEPSYWVLVNGSGGQCDCKGFLATSRDGRTCKHMAVLSRLVERQGI